jgi:hypothetical protein
MSVLQFEELIGKKFVKIEVQRSVLDKDGLKEDNRIEFFLEDGTKYLMWHS